MTLGDCRQLARELRAIRPKSNEAAMIQWRMAVVAIAAVCEDRRLTFSARRFYRACGLDTV